ncbi:MAG: dTDP-4-dehydrorhamnose 3,5-epimerase, partial [Gammaproteobacteria bacterium]
MEIFPTRIPDVIELRPTLHGDERGFFMETYRASMFNEMGIDAQFVQDNHSRSAQNILRGLHYQVAQPQGKLVRVVRGEVYDVAVDLRAQSPTYGQWVGLTLSEKTHNMLWVPPG